jgi:hypothetical protein
MRQRSSASVRAPALLAVATLLALLSSSPVLAEGNLYQGRFVTSGTSEDRRMPGFVACLGDVLVKVSGDAGLLHDPRVDALKQHADTYVASFSYRDLYTGIPLHDEQGSYDRPHYLTVDFDPAKIDTALAGLGLRPWTAERPKLAVFLGVQRYDKRYVVTGDDPRDKAMNEAMAAAAGRFGLSAGFPPAAVIGGLDYAALVKDDNLPALAAAAGATLPLTGTLMWSDQAHGWLADWWLTADGHPHHWQIRGVNFDDAFRNGILGADQVLSGNGEPGDNLLP